MSGQKVISLEDLNRLGGYLISMELDNERIDLGSGGMIYIHCVRWAMSHSQDAR